MAGAAAREADRRAVAGDVAAAAELARRIADLTPDDEPARRRLIELLIRSGDHAGALRAFDAFADRLAAEFGAAPAPETAALVAPLRAVATAGPETRTTGASALPAVAPAPASTAHAVAPGQGPAPVQERRRLPRAVAAAAVTALVVAGVAALRARDEPAIERTTAGATVPTIVPRRVIVAELRNLTGDTALSRVGVLAQHWVTRTLAEVPDADVVDAVSAIEAGREAGAADSASGALALARATGAGTVVRGSFTRRDDRLVFQGQLVDSRRGTVLATLGPVSGPVSDPLIAVDSLADQALVATATLGDPRVRPVRSGERLPSYAAYTAFVEGMEAYIARDLDVAAERFLAAADADSQFTTALLHAVTALEHLGRPAEVVESLYRRIEPARDRLSRFERIWLEHIAAIQRRDWASVRSTSRELARQAPGSQWPLKAASAALWMGHYRTAATELRALDPEQGWLRGWHTYWVILAHADHLLGDYEAELEDARRGRRQYPDHLSVLASQVRPHAAQGRLDSVMALLDEADGKPWVQTWTQGSVMAIAIGELEAHGHPAAAARVRERLRAWWRGLSPAQTAQERGFYGHLWALHEGGLLPEARERALEVMSQPGGDFALPRLAITAAQLGDTAEADRVAERFLARAAMDRRWQPGYLAMFRARLAGAKGDREGALRHLREAFAQGRQRDIHVHAEPEFAVLRGLPEFAELLRSRD